MRVKVANRRSIKNRYDAMEKGGSQALVAKNESQEMAKAQQQAATRAAAGAQQVYNRGAMAAGSGGAVMKGAMQHASAEVAQGAQKAATQATADAQRYRQELVDQRVAQTKAEGQRMLERRQANVTNAMNVVGNLVGNIVDAVL